MKSRLAPAFFYLPRAMNQRANPVDDGIDPHQYAVSRKWDDVAKQQL